MFAGATSTSHAVLCHGTCTSDAWHTYTHESWHTNK